MVKPSPALPDAWAKRDCLSVVEVVLIHGLGVGVTPYLRFISGFGAHALLLIRASLSCDVWRLKACSDARLWPLRLLLSLCNFRSQDGS